MTFVFPTLLILLDLAAATVYAFDADWRRMIYWGAAALLTACVSY